MTTQLSPQAGLAPAEDRTPEPARIGSRRRWLLALVVVAVVILLPIVIGDNGLARLQQILIYLMVGIGLNIAFGYAGEFAVAQPVVMGVAAYMAGILSVTYHWSAWATLPASLIAGVLTGFALSSPGFRLRGWYLTITTFFAAVVFPDVVTLASKWTGGTNGLVGISPLPGVGLVLGSSVREYEIILAITLVLFLAMYNISRSTWGITLRSMRDAPQAAIACGVRVPLVKATVAVVSSIPVALAGWVFAHSSGVLGVGSFNLNLTIIIVAGVVLGGLGTVWGPVVGTAIVGVVTLWVAPLSSYNTLLVGMAVLIFAIALPIGVVPASKGLLARLVASKGAFWKIGRGGKGAAEFSGDGDGGGSASRPPLALRSEPVPPAMEAGEAVCSVVGVHKHFGGVAVLEGVDLSVNRGEVVGLVGPNGSGKTTLLNIITGHVRPDQGRTTLSGAVDIAGMAPQRVADRGVRRTFQVPRLIGELTVEENIRLGLTGSRGQHVLTGILQLPSERRQRRSDNEAVAATAQAMELPGQVLAQTVNELPLGLRRVVEVARAVVAGPTLVCLDEPAAGLGNSELVHLGELIRQVAGRGTGVLLIEHNLGFVASVSDRMVTIVDGRIETVRSEG